MLAKPGRLADNATRVHPAAANSRRSGKRSRQMETNCLDVTAQIQSPPSFGLSWRSREWLLRRKLEGTREWRQLAASAQCPTVADRPTSAVRISRSSHSGKGRMRQARAMRRSRCANPAMRAGSVICNIFFILLFSLLSSLFIVTSAFAASPSPSRPRQRRAVPGSRVQEHR